MIIQTTGLENYAPGGKARVKVLVIGGPGAGKTRWASYFPKPFYADCEAGLAAVADRAVPYSTVQSSQDMLDALAYMKLECTLPAEKRTYETFIVDTLDAFQRKVKDEWMILNKKQVFTGWEAWGYMNSKMSMLMTRLLNLDMNIVVLVHYKDKTTKDDESGKESHTIALQVQGELADTAFNDFDLVAWMGTYWEAVNGERVRKRGLTFKPTPEKPFLKDRLNITPDWLEVNFEPEDYTGLFTAIQSRVAGLKEGVVLGEIVSSVEEPAVSSFVMPPGSVGTGALPAVAPKELTFAQMDRPTLIKTARERGVTTLVDGSPIRGNTLKGELVAALEAHTDAPGTAPPAETTAEQAATAPDSATAAPAQDTREQVAARAKRVTTPATRQVAEGTVDVRTGELIGDAHAAALATVGQVLGGQVIDDPHPQSTPVQAPAPVAKPEPSKAPAMKCDECGKSLTGENPDFVKLSYIKFRRRLCEADYTTQKNAVTTRGPVK